MREFRSGKIPTTSVRRRISRLRRSQVVGPHLPPEALREGREREHVGAGGLVVVRDLGQLLFQGAQDAVELGVHGVRVGLVVNTVQQGFHPGPGGLGCVGHQIRRVVHVMPTSA